MSELQWYRAYPPRDAGLAEITALLRVLVGRPHQGLRRIQPMVAFELWLARDRVRWLLGIEDGVTRTLPGELTAQLPSLAIVAVATPIRPAPVTAREVRLTSHVHPLRADNALAVTAGILGARDLLRGNEQVVLSWVVGPSHAATDVPIKQSPASLFGLTPPRQPDDHERRGWTAKLSEPLFGVRGRVGAVAGDSRRGAELLRPVVSALALAGGPYGRVYASPQSGQVATQLVRVMGRLRNFSGIVNAAELAALSGWCRGGSEVPGGAGAFGPPPDSLLSSGADTSVPVGARPLGHSTHPATENRPVWLPRSSHNVHTHLIAPPGRGKSTLASQWITAEAGSGGSVIVVEPKGDLVHDVLARLRQPARSQIVVLDPGEDDLPVVGFNPLGGSRADAERRADTVLGLLRELFGSAIGPRSADLLLHVLIMASRLDDGTLLDAPTILTNPTFRRWVAAQVSDPLTIAPWLAWFDALSEPERAQVVGPVLNKVRIWTARPAIRRLLGQPQPRFDLASVFARPTVLLVNLNAGAIGPETARLAGALLLQQIWQLSQRQTTLPPTQRRPVSVVLDEFQVFTAGLDFADVLARGRGANVSFTLVHQNLDQLNTGLRAAVLASVGTRVVFRPAAADSRTLAGVLGTTVKPDDLDQLAAYHAVARVLVAGVPSSPFEVVTAPLSDALQDPATLRRASAERYGTSGATIDAALLARWQGGGPPEAPVGVRRLPS